MDRSPSYPRLLAVGPIVLDELAMGSSELRHPGGNGVIVAAVAARLGLPTALAGCTGDDPPGRRVREILEEHGVDLRWLRTVGGMVTKVVRNRVLPDGGWSWIESRPARFPYLPSELPGAVRERIGADRDGIVHVHVGGAPSLLRACASSTRDLLAIARGKGASISLGFSRFEDAQRPALEKLVRGDEWLFFSEDEFYRFVGARLRGEAAMAGLLRAAPSDRCIVTLGARGAWCRWGGPDSILRVVVQPRVARSSVGAGDTFAAIVLVSVLRGAPLSESLRLASAGAAESLGSRTWDGWLRDLEGYNDLAGRAEGAEMILRPPRDGT